MDNIKKILSENFKKALLTEARVLPSDADIASCPSIYKGVDNAESYVEMGFQHQLATGGKCVGEGIYARLSYEEAVRCVYSYGPDIVQGKVLGGFKNYIMFDADIFPSIKRQVISYYGALLSPADQVKSIVKDPRDAQLIIKAGKSMNNNTFIVKLCRRYGIRGMMYEWDSCATVLPFDFASVVVWAAAKNVRYNKNAPLVKTFNQEARERYERHFDWDFQLFGRYDSYDKTKITRVATNNEMYALVQDFSKGWNFVKLDTRIVANPQPEEISDIWYKNQPSQPSIKTGIFGFDYNGIQFFGAVFLPNAKDTPALWYPEDLSQMNRPNLSSINDWVDLDKATLDEVCAELKQYKAINESLKVSLKKHINETISEEIKDKDENEFISKHRCYVYRATRPSGFESIFNNGQLRQFAGSNDGSWYGEGVYAVVRPEDVQYHKYDKETHAGGVKMIVLGGYSNFLIFEETWAKKVYGANWQVKDQFYTLFPKEVADDVMRDYNNWLPRAGSTNLPMVKCTWNYGNGTRTTGFLHYIFDNGHLRAKYTNLFSKYNIRGTIYVGGNDGLTALCWNFDQVIPYQYTTDCGRTWHSDLFNFQLTKERSFKNTDPVSKFRHLYDFVSDKIVSCNINGKNFNVTTVKNKGRWNIININSPKGEKISPIDFDTEPKIGLSGIFNFVYQGVQLQGIVLLPEINKGAVWFPEDMSLLKSRPNITNLNDWVAFEDLDEVVMEIKNMQL